MSGFDESGLEQVETEFGRFLVSPRWDPIIHKHLSRCGAQQRGDLEILKTLLKPGDVVYDIGANIGSISIPLALHVGETGRVVSIEGSPDTFLTLSRNIELNGLTERVSARNAVVSSGAAEGAGYAMERGEDGNRGRTRFRTAPAAPETPPSPSPPEAGEAPEPPAESFDETVPATSLDALAEAFPAPRLVKIDVEGMEPEVFEGGWRMIRAAKPILFFETNADAKAVDAVARRLIAEGYRIFANTGERNGARPAWRLTEINPLLSPFAAHLDLLAIPAGTDLSGTPHEGRWNGRMLRAAAGRGLRRLRGG